MRWNKNYAKFLSCETNEWFHKSKGFCTKCYPLVKMITILESWDFKIPATIIPVGPINRIIRDLIIRSDKVNEVKEGLIEDIKSQIHLYKRYNSPSDEGMSIEF